ncbi:MAG: hypothetical protein WAW17_21780 [Rhodococcus sp. (in: high G+C Gram-positive bacteria)]|uniref:hypothetical protein n=1 Tax=Rhodococcus sp. TaxID=1831 RepID=UPI003BAEC055
MAVVVDTAYVGPGVETGTRVMLHGASIGKVTDVARSDGAITLGLELDKDLAQGLTRNFVMDFRPSNYFGITALSIADPGSGGLPLAGGDRIATTPGGDFTMARMIEQGSAVANGTLTDSTVAAIDQVLAYTDALSPLLSGWIR